MHIIRYKKANLCVEFISKIKNSYHFENLLLYSTTVTQGTVTHTYKCTDIPGTCPLVAMALREIAVRKVCGDRITFDKECTSQNNGTDDNYNHSMCVAFTVIAMMTSL